MPTKKLKIAELLFYTYMEGSVHMNWKKKIISTISLVSFTTLIIHIINKLNYFSATMDNLLSSTSGSYYNWKFGKYITKKSVQVIRFSSFTIWTPTVPVMNGIKF